MTFLDINFLGVAIAIIVNIILGMLWYSHSFLGTMWAKELCFDRERLKPTPWHFIGAILVSLVTAVIFSLLLHWFNIVTISEGIKLGFFLWLGFITTTHFSGVIWAGKPLKVYLVDMGYQLISLLLMGAILTYWR